MRLSVPSFLNTRVLVAGDVMLDRYWHGNTSRISPEAPVPVVHIRDVEERPGGAANVAMNIAALGAKPVLLGITGNDEAGRALEQLLNAEGVASRLQTLAGFATVTKMRVVSRHQQLIRLDFEEGFDGTGLDQMLSVYAEELRGVGAVVLSDYGKGALRTPQAFIQQARKMDVPVLVDPKGHDFSRYSGATVITPNLAEFEGAVGTCHDQEALATKGEALRQELGLEALLITRGEQGMTCLRAGQPALHLPTRAREVYDVTGAGDTVIGVLAAALAAGQGLVQAMALSNHAAGIVVAKLGTASATVEELESALHQQIPHRLGVADEADLLATVKAARARGETIVMTNGCFDILHAGHVGYLAKAKALGDRLIVAVNDDASVQRLKGHGRPVNTLVRRMAVLAALESVDWVVPFSEDTPERLICAVLPAILVKGGDYQPDEVVGSECVRARGGRVEILSFEEGCSTTATLEAIDRAVRAKTKGRARS